GRRNRGKDEAREDASTLSTLRRATEDGRSRATAEDGHPPGLGALRAASGERVLSGVSFRRVRAAIPQEAGAEALTPFGRKFLDIPSIYGIDLPAMQTMQTRNAKCETRKPKRGGGRCARPLRRAETHEPRKGS